MTYTIANGIQVILNIGSKIVLADGVIPSLDNKILTVVSIDNNFPYVWDGYQNSAISPENFKEVVINGE